MSRTYDVVIIDAELLGGHVALLLSPFGLDSHRVKNDLESFKEFIEGRAVYLLGSSAVLRWLATILMGVPDIDVLRVPHHGGDTSLPAFIDTLDPQIAVISVGQPNPYGHPNPNALAELDGVGAQIWRTDQHGTITISFTDQGPVVASER